MKSCLSKINHFCSYKTHFVTHNDLLENWMTCHLARNHVRAHDVMCIFYFWHQHVRFKIKCHVGSSTYVEMTPLSPTMCYYTSSNHQLLQNAVLYPKNGVRSVNLQIPAKSSKLKEIGTINAISA